jgi:uncharacterized protein (DUF58 family)
VIPRGVRPQHATLLALRRHGPEMRRILALDAERREAAQAIAAPGQGMDYAESRPYSPGDDVRRIDWRVTARTGRAHTKLYRHERGRDVYCIADQRAPMHFGTRAAFKSVVAAELAALAGWAAAAGGERFGALVAGARVALVRSGAAEGSTPALCAALSAQEDGESAPATPSLDALAARAAQEAALGTRFVVVSDFADDDAALARAVGRLRARGDVVLVWVLDPMELRLPPPGRYALSDGREHLVLDTARPGVRAAQARELALRRERLARFGAQPGVRLRAVSTGEDLLAALGRPFERSSAR